MKLFTIPAGTSSQVIQNGKAWEPQNFIKWVTKTECVFEVEDIVFDPIVSSKAKLLPVQASLVKHNFSAFKRDGYVVIVPNSSVRRL
jgi:hypothetical protein